MLKDAKYSLCAVLLLGICLVPFCDTASASPVKKQAKSSAVVKPGSVKTSSAKTNPDKTRVEKRSAIVKKKLVQQASSTRSPQADVSDSEGDDQAPALQRPADSCSALLLLDPLSGASIFEQNANQSLPPASMVKLMTTYVVMKRVKEGQLRLSDEAIASAHASKMGGSQVFLKEGERFAIDDLLNALLIQSANDAGMAIAEHVGGSEEGFVAMMNSEAKSLGMTQSEFHSPHGLPPSSGEKPDLVSARDFGILASALIKQFPEILTRTSLMETTFRNGEFKMTSHNHLLKNYPGCDGLKTGYYAKAGFSIAATAQRNGSRLVAVVMGCANRKFRDKETARLLSLGFSQTKVVKLVEQGAAIEKLVNVTGGEKSQTSPVALQTLSVPVLGGDEARIERRVELCSELQAPVKSGTPCGAVKYLLNGTELGSVQYAVMEDIKKAGIIGRFRANLGL